MNRLASIFRLPVPAKRVYGLDIIRSTAILIVIYQHGTPIWPDWAQKIYGIVKVDGVTIFFVLSGFLIGRILIEVLENKSETFSSLIYFWCRRWFRTLPIYYIILSVAAFLYPIIRPDIKVEHLGRYYVFLQNWFYPHPKFNNVAWSLSVEEWFYLIVPAAAFFLVRMSKASTKQAILLVCIAVLLFSLGFRHFRFYDAGISSYEQWGRLFRMQVITRLDSIIIGVLGAYWFLSHHNTWRYFSKSLLLIGLTILLLSCAMKAGNLYSPYGYYASVFSFQVEAMATLFIIPFFSTYKGKENFWHKLITIISLVSYSAYLLHNTLILELIVQKIDWFNILPVENLNLILKYVAYWALTFISSILCYKYLELPLMNLRDNQLLKRWLKVPGRN